VILLGAACASDPIYLAAEPPSIVTGDGTDGGVAALVLTVPMLVEDDEAAERRAAIAEELDLPLEDIPTVRRDETDLEVEWTLTNDGEEDAVARLAVIAANELFRYDPTVFAEDEEDEPPPLMGGRPIDVPAGRAVSGVFREDELAEAAQDLDAFTRGGVVAQRALVTRWPTRDVTGGEGGILPEIPSRAVPLLLELVLSVEADRPLTVTALLRVRDRSNRLDENAVDPGTLVPASTTVYVPPVPVP
jgi:hypothetical protein